MTLLAVRLATFPLLLSIGACGGETVGVDPRLFDPGATDAGVGTGSGSGSAPVPDAGTPTREEAGTPIPTSGDAGPKTPPNGGDASTGSACLTSADCTGGAQCAWPVTFDICIAFNPAGSCVVPNNDPCNSESEAVGCGCDGVDVHWTTGCVGLPAGWAPVGLAHDGPCAPLPDAGTTCKTAADCGPGDVCVWVINPQTGIDTWTCTPDPCGTNPLSCDCADPLCNGTGGRCEVEDGGVVGCISMG